jgi:hypothetical protein
VRSICASPLSAVQSKNRSRSVLSLLLSSLLYTLKSQEERTEDYVKAYAATTQPPQPLPQFPKEDSTRLALGLPPLFQPHVEVIATTTSSSGSTLSSATVRPFFNNNASSGAAGSCAHIKEPANLPTIQSFNYATFDDDKSRFTSIGTLYTFFSHEVRVLSFSSLTGSPRLFNKFFPTSGNALLCISKWQQVPTTRHRNEHIAPCY